MASYLPASALALFYHNNIPYRVNAKTLAEYLGEHAGVLTKAEYPTLPKFYQIGDIPDLSEGYKQSSQSTYGSFGINAKEEVQAVLNGGYYQGNHSAITAPIIAEADIRLATLDSILNQKVETRLLTSSSLTIPFLAVNTTQQDNPIPPNPFVPSKVYGGAYTHFIYDGVAPTHIQLKGSLKVLLRVNTEKTQNALQRQGSAGIIPPTLNLRMSTTNIPTGEVLNHHLLGVSNHFQTKEVFKLDPYKSYGATLKGFDDLEPLLADVPRKNYTVMDGSIPTNSISPDWGVSGSGHYMTSWFDIGCETRLWMRVNNTSSCYRHQFRDVEGNIFFDDRSGVTGSGSNPNRVQSIPPTAVAMRVYFSNGDVPTDLATDITIKAIPEKYDPLYGMWAEYDINPSLTHYLEPNHEYTFTLHTTSGSQVVLDKGGLMIPSGHLSFLFNARSELEKRLEMDQELLNDPNA